MKLFDEARITKNKLSDTTLSKNVHDSLIKADLVGDVVDDDDAMRPPVVTRSNRPKTLLTRLERNTHIVLKIMPQQMFKKYQPYPISAV